MIPGEVFPAEGVITLNAGREVIAVAVTNVADRPIQVGSHFHFYEVNSALQFPRKQAYGMRLDIPAGTAMRFEPGDSRTVMLIPYSGERQVFGFNGLVEGPLGEH